MDRHAPADLTRRRCDQGERRQRGADRALARPRPPGLRGDACASRATSHATRSSRWPAALLARHRRPVHADPRGREPRRGAPGWRELFPRARSYLDVYARARPAGPRARCCAHGIWLDDARPRAAARASVRADRALPDAPTCSSAAGLLRLARARGRRRAP
ncbi:MAG: hypothetical protein MZW92_56550 [Comamonadaceae bacterium]|nr:hypothetical protein [Comamonadaceae bacterium]